VNVARGLAPVAALAAVAVGIGFLIGYPAVGGAATTIAFAAVVALITTRDLAARAQLRTRPVRRIADPTRLDQLRRVGLVLTAAQVSEFGVDHDLRPLLRPIAAMRLARRGVDLDRHRDKARALLGERLWELVRADRAPSSNRVAGGISASELRCLIECLERI
jgi:hypothetical protein